MAQKQDIILKLIEKLEFLYQKQADFTTEINSLKEELYRLKSESEDLSTVPDAPMVVSETELVKVEPKQIDKTDPVVNNDIKTNEEESTQEEPVKIIKRPQYVQAKGSDYKKSTSKLEKFIGENLLNKIGILITILGVAIGAKYTIENNLISPLTRILLGYFMALGLLGFGVKLKKKFEAFSSVLVSGAIVILYFITFFAYSFYDLIPQLVAFVLMVVFTVFTVVAAITYNRQIIAHLGLVGAYAVPFLLSNESGRAEVLFGYITIINIGILVIAFKKYWKPLYYSAFGLTWLIFASWFLAGYDFELHFYKALSFLSVFFAIFYITFLAYKLRAKLTYTVADVILLLLNSFIFYGFGYAIINAHETGNQLLGAFTLSNAFIHFMVSVIIYKQKLADKNLFYLISGLVLIFITIAIPVQLDGNWVTLLWAGEAGLLFWIGRTKGVSVYEKLSYPLMLIAFFSIIQDWSIQYDFYYRNAAEQYVTPLFNIYFLSSALFIGVFLFISKLNKHPSYQPGLKPEGSTFKMVSYTISAILIFSLYYAFRLEIASYWEQLVFQSELKNQALNGAETLKNYDLRDFKAVWILNYSLLFVSVLAIINFRKIKSEVLAHATFLLTSVAIFAFLVNGLYVLSDLRESYLNPSDYFNTGVYHLMIRYMSFLFLALALLMCSKYIKQSYVKPNYRVVFDILLHITLLWVLSSELIHWMDIFGSEQSYKLGLSILWGLYSFVLITFGILKTKQYLRIGGIGLFGITLVKLFFYDIVHLNTISKTIVFVSLGVLLLIISFLYNKYKNHISDDTKN